MKEISFIKHNIEKWRTMEDVVDAGFRVSPDQLADAYQELTADLAFAQTHYPQSRITLYLNNLASALHNEIYRNKRERKSRLITYWTHEVPQTMWEARRLLLASLLVFALSVLIGVVSSLADADFPRLIMGDSYIDMTLNNIANGRPMGVYASEDEVEMFLGITLNNVYVSFLCFASGLFTSFLTGWLLLRNGLMLGAFHAFFFQQGLLDQALPAIWLHGTLEISSIIVAGAAGFSLGGGWLFPGTYTRMASFRKGAVRGMKIVAGTFPLFCIAGFIESFITRHVEYPDALRLAVILLSLCFVVGYFAVLPWWLYGRRHAPRPEKINIHGNNDFTLTGTED